MTLMLWETTSCSSRAIRARSSAAAALARSRAGARQLRALRYLVEALRPQAERVSEGPCATEQRGHEQEVPAGWSRTIGP